MLCQNKRKCKFDIDLNSVLINKFISRLRKCFILDELSEEEGTIAFEAVVQLGLNKETRVVQH